MLTPWAFWTWNMRSQAWPNTSLHWLHFKWTFLPWDVSSWKPAATNNEDKCSTFIWFIKSEILLKLLQLLTDKMSQSQRREGKVSAFIDLSFIPKKNLAVGPRKGRRGVHYHGRYGVNVLSVSVTSCQIRKKEKTFLPTKLFVNTTSGYIILFSKGNYKNNFIFIYESGGKTWQDLSKHSK